VVHLHLAGPGTGPEPAAGAAPPRVGLVVSKAVGPAVTRNQVKRRLRHLLRDRVALLPAGSVLVVRALPASAQASSTTLAADLDRALTRAARPS
jgi:ribonuclease P protein component